MVLVDWPYPGAVAINDSDLARLASKDKGVFPTGLPFAMMLAGTFEFTVTVCLLPTPKEQEQLIAMDTDVIDATMRLWVFFMVSFWIKFSTCKGVSMI
jgi:hypothetical protein